MSDDLRPAILLCTSTWWPLSARLAEAFLRQGVQVAAVCPEGNPLRLVPGLTAIYPYRCIGSLASLKHAIEAFQPTLIVPCDDGVVWQLHELHARHPELQALVERSLGAKECFADVRSRAVVTARAAALGIKVPESAAIGTEEELSCAAADGLAAVKVDGTWGGSGVAITRSRGEAVAAFRALSRPRGLGEACKRWLINRDPLAFWTWRRRDLPRVTMQSFVEGRPWNAMMACHEGTVLGMVTAQVITSQGLTGAANVIRLEENSDIRRAAESIADEFRLSGFHGLDFIVETRTGDAYFLELNPRCTQLGHLNLTPEGDLVGLLCARMFDWPSPVRAGGAFIDEKIVAFYPQARMWNASSPYVLVGYHDVPRENPELAVELLRAAWPERRLLSRVYHWLRGTKRCAELAYEGIFPGQPSRPVHVADETASLGGERGWGFEAAQPAANQPNA